MPAARRQQVAPNGVIGISIFVIAEMMLFAGFISAHSIVKTSALEGWPPPGQPRLPIGETAINTAALLLSGLFLVLAHRAFHRDAAAAMRKLAVAIGLGAFFVVFQGAEWVALLGEGLTVTSSTHGGFFYLIVGTHALHAMAALGVLIWAFLRFRGGRLVMSELMTAEIFWYFVVGLWPILYWRVYL
ncbi:MAG: cytochrome c oxidase subunit 3 [Myxococcales bacterium]|nr:cytochrome c oxidase subunit 3 [Myxococcales bacterium]